MLVVYNPPKADKFYFFDELDKTLKALSIKKYPVITCGDFNIDILKANNLSSKYHDVIESNGFEQMINKPTRIAKISETILDDFIA